MDLTIDIGNTACKYFLFEDGQIVAHGSEMGHNLSGLLDWLDGTLPQRAIICSVVDLPQEARESINALPCPVLHFNHTTPVPIKNCYRTPTTLGLDRLAAAVGAWAQHQGKPLLIIDAGSCITFDFVSPQGEYLGGNIAPGLHARLQSIGDYFPRLPLVDAEGDVPALGYDTTTAIRAGAIEGIRHEIEGYIHHFRQKYEDLLVFLTGGDHFCFDETTKSIIFADQFLVARGLHCILGYTQTKK